jgi:serine/threonine-protein kinase
MAEAKRPDNSSQKNGPSGTAGQPNAAKRPTASPSDGADGDGGTIDLTGRVLGDFCLLRKLGKGGMADVYLAEQTSLRRQVAIKIMRADFVADPQYVKRFRHEASAAGGLNHPNIVQVYMVGEQDGIHFISQEYVQGRNLKEFITRKGPLEVPIALHILKQVSAALQVAADKGIVHRDIKPENILLTRKGEAKVADFGLAQLTLGGEKVALTQEGVTMGTPLYMSPEQVNGRPLDARSDIYSLGVMSWHMLAGHPPFTGQTALAVAVKHLNEEPPSLAEIRPDIPPGLLDLISRMMAKKKEERPADAQSVLVEVKQLLRQVTGKDAPPESAFRAGKGGTTTQISTKLLERPLKKQAVWIAVSCAIVLAGSAGVGWAMRTADPMKLPVIDSRKVEIYPTLDGQFYHALGNPTDEAAWYAVKEKLASDSGEPSRQAAYNRMRDRCDLYLAMIYLNDGRREQASRTFNEFAASPDPWRKAHGLAGLAVFEDLKGAKANRDEVVKSGQQAMNLVREAGDGDRRLESNLQTALQDAMNRRP